MSDYSFSTDSNDFRVHGQYTVDGHHIRFNCCGKVLAILPNESDDYSNFVSCPFCDAKIDGQEDEDICETCLFYPPSACSGKPCTACGHGNPRYQRKENEDA